MTHRLYKHMDRNTDYQVMMVASKYNKNFRKCYILEWKQMNNDSENNSKERRYKYSYWRNYYEGCLYVIDGYAEKVPAKI